MAIFRNLRVKLRFESSKYFNVFLRLKSSPSLTLQEISHSRTASCVPRIEKDVQTGSRPCFFWKEFEAQYMG
jgi:hypothetical protein